jgi:ribA/ribD-fused uncharacterized protein
MDKFVMFWHPNGANGVFSQWYNSQMIEMDIIFSNAEQYMMYHKALLFADKTTASKILNNPDPKTCKALGRQIRNFDENIWSKNRERIVLQGNYLKFSQNARLRNLLLERGENALFVEASPLDRIWGIGYTADNALANIHNWGLNLLGKALNQTYIRLKENSNSG